MKFQNVFRQAIITKYLCPTNFKGSRIKAYYLGGSIIMQCDSNLNMDQNHEMAAKILMKELEWDRYNVLIGGVTHKGDYVFVLIPKKRKTK